MSTASDIVNVVVSLSATGPTRAGFGEALIAGYHTHYTDRVREYSDLPSMVVDGFTVNDPLYIAASKHLAQSPRPTAVKIGRCALPGQQIVTLTLTSTSATDTYKFSIGVPGATPTAFSIASTGVPATDAATLNTAITAASIPNLTATHVSAVITLTGTAAHGVSFDVSPDTVHMTFAETTTDPGIQTDLNAIIVADTNWYGLLLASNSPAEILQAAAWCESNARLGGFNATDTAIMNSGSTTDVAYLMKTSAYGYSFGLMSKGQLLSYNAAAWMGRMFPYDAGSENWAYKTLASVAVDAFTLTEQHAVEAKNWNTYSNIMGLNLTRFGKTPGGYGFIDLRRGVDWIVNSFQVGIIGALANNLKIAFTDKGLDVIASVILGVLAQGVQRNFLASTPAPAVNIPLVANISTTDKQNRNVPNVSASATLAGAVNTLIPFNVSLTT